VVVNINVGFTFVNASDGVININLVSLSLRMDLYERIEHERESFVRLCGATELGTTLDIVLLGLSCMQRDLDQAKEYARTDVNGAVYLLAGAQSHRENVLGILDDINYASSVPRDYVNRKFEDGVREVEGIIKS
jgi:hypothetical protein